MSAPSLAATQMVRIWELRASIEPAAHLIPEAAADSNFLLRFDSLHVISRAALHANCIQ
jgi:hypothetical protein